MPPSPLPLLQAALAKEIAKQEKTTADAALIFMLSS